MARHAPTEIDGVSLLGYNLKMTDRDGFVGDHARARAMFEIVGDLRSQLQAIGKDPVAWKPGETLSKKDLDHLLRKGSTAAGGLIFSAVEEYAQTLAGVIRSFRKAKTWKRAEKIAIGGGLRDSRAGELAIGRAMTILQAEGQAIELQPIHNDPDEAALIGGAKLVASQSPAGLRTMIAVDIGGGSIRAGLLELPRKRPLKLQKVKVASMLQWKHGEDDPPPSREEAVDRLAKMVEELIAEADLESLLTSVSIACPGMIDRDGNIMEGDQNLPGDWHGDDFNLPAALSDKINGEKRAEFSFIMHNDAVIQGLSEYPNMQDVEYWAVLTIGTGLGNASFRNVG